MRGKNKEKLLDAGLELIHAQGFHATGVQDIASRAGVPKGSFYNYFDSKEDFLVSVIELYTRHTYDVLQQRLIDAGGHARTKLKALLESWAIDMFGVLGGCGCLIGNLSQEVANQHPTVRQALARSFHHLEAQFVRCLNEGQARGELPPGVNAEALASFLYQGWHGALVRAKAEGNKAQLEAYISYAFAEVFPPMANKLPSHRGEA